MVLTGPQKAAALLMNLDPSAAADLLGSAKPEVITEIATELAYLSQADEQKQAALDALAQEILTVLIARQRPGGEALVRQILETLMGPERSRAVLREVSERVRTRDPFLPLRSAEVADVAACLEGESAQVISLVLSELPAKKGTDLLQTLDEQMRAATVRQLAAGQEVSAEAKLRVATVVQSRLTERRDREVAPEADQATSRQQQLRKVAVLLRGMEVKTREQLSRSLAEQDREAADTVSKLMVLWEDIPQVSARSLQQALRSADAQKLALALVDADEQTTAKIRENISERARAMVEEESTLLSAPKEEDVRQAREEILGAMREMNAQGELGFEEQ